jgi:hypothetical protein
MIKPCQRGARTSKRLGKQRAGCRGSTNETSTARATRGHQASNSLHNALFLHFSLPHPGGPLESCKRCCASFLAIFFKKKTCDCARCSWWVLLRHIDGSASLALALSRACALCRPLALSVPASLAARIPRALRAMPASTNTIACGTTLRHCLHLRFPCPLRWRCVHARWHAVALIRCTSECVPYFACEL